MEERIKTIEDKFDDFSEKLDGLLKKFESLTTSAGSSQSVSTETNTNVNNYTTSNAATGTVEGATGPSSNSTLAGAWSMNPQPDTSVDDTDVQAAFIAIKSSVQSVRLPAELTLSSTSNTGLRKGDGQTHFILL